MRLKFNHLRSTDVEYYNLLHDIQQTYGVQVYPFGSRYTVGKDYGDTDVLVLCVKDTVKDAVTADGYLPHIARGYAGSQIASHRKGDVNLVLSYCEWEFLARAACAELCRAQNITDKGDRRFIHKMIADVPRAETHDFEFHDTKSMSIFD